MRRIEGWFDGACEPFNPGGHTSYGALVKVDSVTTWREARYLGDGPRMSSNVGEYSGAIACMRQLLRVVESFAAPSVVIMRGDSMLVIKQLDGHWRVKGGLYLPYYREAVGLRARLHNMRLEWVPRNLNEEADELSKQALRDKNKSIGFTKENTL